MKSVMDKVVDTINEYRLIEKGENVVVGVSGGPDSICLLHTLLFLKERFSIQTIAAVHINHMYRGEEALQDQRYTENFCQHAGIPCFVYSVNVEEMAKKERISTEEAGRKVRYEAFDEVLEKIGGGKIAVAHNADDQAETILMRIIRGTGPDGLAGMEFMRAGKIIRPLLSISRKEIEAYCEEHHLNPAIDKTNLTPIYRRNAIRLELIPKIDEMFGGNFKESIYHLGEIAKEDREFIHSFVDQVLSNAITRKDYLELPWRTVQALHPTVRKRVFIKAFGMIGLLSGISAVQLNQGERLCFSPKSTWIVEFPSGYRLKRRYDRIICEKVHQIDTQSYYYEINADQVVQVLEAGLLLETELIDDVTKVKQIKETWFQREKDSGTQFFDYQKLSMPLQLRRKRGKERFSPLGFDGTKKLKEYFIEQKIDPDIRAEIPLICQGDQVIWIIGHKINDRSKIEAKTERILRISAKPLSIEETGNSFGFATKEKIEKEK